MRAYGFHPDALLEYAEATTHYLRESSAKVAESFVVAVESAVSNILNDPGRRRVV